MNLNESQNRAVNFFKGPCLVLAGPGSGKTFVITSRIKNLIDAYNVPPEKILVATFSRAAANEMKSRFENLCEKSYDVSPLFGTFHSIFFMILKASYNYDSKSIINDVKKYELLRSEVERLNIFYENENDFFQTLVNEISRIKNNFENASTFCPAFVSSNDFIQIYNSYERALRELSLIDYDDMMNLCYHLLKDNPKILKHYQEQFAFILIDEFQDINPIQYEIMKMLAAPHNNIFIVGDDDQSIYGFRGASPLIMKQFAKDFPTLQYVQLDTNYRSSKQITDFALQVINENLSRFNKIIKNVNYGANASLQINKYENQEKEYQHIANEINVLLSNGSSPSEIAILIRSFHDLSLLTSILNQNNIPCISKNKSTNIFNSFIASDIISYLKIAYALCGRLPGNLVKLNDFVSIMNKPSRYISRNSICDITINTGNHNCNNTSGKTNPIRSANNQFDITKLFYSLRNYYKNNLHLLPNIIRFEKDLRFMGSLPLYAAVQYLISAVKYTDYLKEISMKNGKDLKDYLSILNEIKKSCEGFIDINKWLEYISERSNLKCDESSASHVQILTLHASKGLEFETVFIPDVNEGIIPHVKCTSKEQLEEERRLLYVGITRAKTNLYLSYVENIRSKKAFPSRFIAPLLSRDKKP